ncbi:putative late blight resistance protein homolog R1A-4 [Salvia miltiorrhiza]|uniref:putative late blight resistance protein homolog R1A-4 n=1 Tax=Salvia miltiorrhiza TaxID=226208 RepID=UPI0025AB8F4B|nr:putative late blight resistance protein homolog R1A-4 [Salvia miltiorrhiza]
MTAYGAVNSLRNTIDYILYSSHYSLVDPSPHIRLDAYKELRPLQNILEKLDRTRTSKSRKKVNALDRRIKDLIWEFQHLLETILHQQILGIPSQPQILSQSPNQVEDERMKERGFLESLPSQPRRKFNTPRIANDVEGCRFSIDLQFLQHHVPSFIQRLKNMKEEYINEVANMPEDDDDDDQSISSRTGTKSKMIGLSDQFKKLKMTIKHCEGRRFIALVGTAGIGKTALAEAVFEDPEIISLLKHRVWVTVGRRSQFADVYQSIVAQMNGKSQEFERKKCLIVLDDVWEMTMFSCSFHPVPFLNEEESKELLCEKVFGEEGCPFHLDKAATKIAKNCEGLPLMIVIVADIISKAQNNTDPKYWDDVAEMRNSVFTDAYNEISKIMISPYTSS